MFRFHHGVVDRIMTIRLLELKRKTSTACSECACPECSKIFSCHGPSGCREDTCSEANTGCLGYSSQRCCLSLESASNLQGRVE